jgi:hypothetical protein
MTARLIQLDGDREVATFDLDAETFRIGRDPSSELVTSSSRVSRQHARIEPSGSGHVLVDLGTPNGSTVNGRPVAGREPLANGDKIVIGGAILLVYRSQRVQSVALWVALAALLLGVAWVGFVYVSPWVTSQLGGGSGGARVSGPEEAAWDQAAALALGATQASDPDQARARFKTAVGVLYKAGLLDDIERGAVMDHALDQLGARLKPRIDLRARFAEAVAATRVPDPSGRPACRMDTPARLTPCLRVSIDWVFARLHQRSPDVPDFFIAQVASVMRREHGFLRRSLDRGVPYVPMLISELEQKHMPGLLHYLAMIESGYKPNALSHAGAAGMWQFMKPTARDYGLRVDGTVDERLDVPKSTRAAAQYLQHLVFEFGSDALVLALAGYNYGQGRVRGALKKLDDPFNDRSYWRLVERGLLPDETALYVARFVAAAVAGEAGLPPSEVLEAAGY